MKSLQVASILIIFSISVARGSSSNEEIDKCIDAYNNQKEVEMNCLKTSLDRGTFTAEADATLQNYTGDDEAVRQFAAKYCPKLKNATSCLPLRYQIPNYCSYEFSIARKESELLQEVQLTILNYACANNAEVLIQVMHNDGLSSVVENEKFRTCARKMNQYPMAKYGKDEFELNPAFCNAQEQALECYVASVKSHKNEDLAVIANTIWTKAKDILKC